MLGETVEKRRYKREELNIDGLFYIQGGEYGRIEFGGKIINISECGIAIKVTRPEDIDIANDVAVGEELKFLFVDTYIVFRQEKVADVVGMMTVVRKDTVDGTIILGCEIKRMSDKLSEYIDDIKVKAFHERGCRL